MSGRKRARLTNGGMASHLTDFYIVGASDYYVYASIKFRWRSSSTPEPAFFTLKRSASGTFRLCRFINQSRVVFYFENRSGPARRPPDRGGNISSFFPELLHKPFAIGRYIWYTLSMKRKKNTK